MQPDEGSLPLNPEVSQEPDRGVGRYVTWRTRDLVIGFVAVLILYALIPSLFYIPAVIATSSDSAESDFATALGSVFWFIAMAFTVHYIVRRSGGSWRELGFRRPDPARWPMPKLLGFIALCYFAAIVAVQLYSLLINLADLDFLKPRDQIPDDFFDNSFVVAMIGVSVVFGAPIAEEIFFRGFLFAGIHRRATFVMAAVVSGVIFSLAHLDPGLILPFTIVGIVLAYAYEKADSLYAAMGLHFVFNCVSFLALLLVPEARNA